jgi:hypothetical protein
MSEQLNSVKLEKLFFSRFLNCNNFLSMIAMTIILFAHYNRLND